MKKQAEIAQEVVAVEEVKVHPLQKSYMFVSKKHVDYENLDAFEAVSLSLVMILAVTAGTILSMNVLT